MRTANEKKTAIAFVTPQYGLVGGAENYAYHLAEQLSPQEDFEIHVFANRWSHASPRIIFHKVPVIQFPRFMKPISFAFFCDRLTRAGRFDLIHSHARIFRMDVLTMHGIPHISWVKNVRKKHMSLFDRATAWVEKCGLKTGLPVITAVSCIAKEELLRRYDIPEKRLKVIHPGISPERFYRLDRSTCRNEIRTRHGLLFSDIVVLFVGLNYEVKRLDLVLEGMAELVRGNTACQSAKLLVVGKPPPHRYLSLARSLGIAERCFFAGITQEIEKYYLASDIFIMPSRYDAFGLVVLEAMMAGLPVVITEKVGAKDLVQSGIQGFVLKDHPSPIDIAEQLAVLFKKETRLAMGREAKRAASDHRWEKKGRLVADIYRSLSEDKQKGVYSAQ